ncbi:hypothetical protein LXA43DRAFT_316351 [Ganoderma leucocontextum]|nr:hypothetical protein LXA43DRAFT_316351 [Ganoderma leucocontextum]
MQAYHPCLFPSSPTLDTLNEDVLRLIVDQLCDRAALRNLASSSHKLRDICLPALFSRREVDIRKHGMDYLPEEVRVHVQYVPSVILLMMVPWNQRLVFRHLTHLGPLGKEQDVEYFEALLGRFPSLQSVAIKATSGHMPWGIWKACVSQPRIRSLSYDAGRHDLAISPFPSDEVEATPVSLQTFSYTTTMWRELCYDTDIPSTIYPRPISIRPVFEFERECLSAIVLRMNETAVSLTLPLESTPILAMAELSWPKLKELNLHGRFLDAVQVTHIRSLLSSLPSLARLSILAARPPEVGRPPFLPNAASPFSLESPPRPLYDVPRLRFNTTLILSSFSPQFSTSRLASPPLSNAESLSEPPLTQLRALEIAFPDPMDDIFSIPMPMLSHLALRDQPRIYHKHTRCHPIGREGSTMKFWHTPILLDHDILSILRRMELPLLRSLEIVYKITEENSDSELISYVVGAFPHLEHLEVHRYRYRRNMSTRHKPIAEILSRAQSLRTVRLNLDFHDDPLAYCGNPYPHLRDKWLQTLRKERGPEIVEVMQACPLLERVAILYHDRPSSVWVEFYPSDAPNVGL